MAVLHFRPQIMTCLQELEISVKELDGSVSPYKLANPLKYLYIQTGRPKSISMQTDFPLIDSRVKVSLRI